MARSEQIREDLQNILNQKEYQEYYGSGKNIIQVWWENLKTWFRNFLSDLFEGFEPSSTLSDTILIIVFGVVILLVLFGVFLLLRSSRRKRSSSSQQVFSSTNELEWSVDKHLQTASEQATEEHYSFAIRHQFLALLLSFHEQGWLRADTWKTNWDYFDELRKKDKQRATSFYEVARTFDEVFYGEREMNQREYENYRDLISTWLNNSSEDENEKA